ERPVIGAARPQHADDRPLGLAIGLGHRRPVGLERHGESPPVMLEGHRAPGARRLHHGFEPCVHTESLPRSANRRTTPARRDGEVYAGIVAGPRQGAAGPFNALLRSPDVADRVQRVGEYVRFQTTIPAPLNEMAILITGRFWSAQYEFWAHSRLARTAGLD